MAHFTNDELNDLQLALVGAQLIDVGTRHALLSGIAPTVRGLMPALAAPLPQLLSDLGRLNDIEQLTDGTVPMEIYLKNCVLLTTGLPQGEVLRAALDKMTSRIHGQPPIADADVPDIPKKVTDALEIIILENDMLPIGFLEAGFRAGRSVARLKVRRYENGVAQNLPSGEPFMVLGTGWMIAGDLLITNHHVVNVRRGYENDASEQDFRLQAEHLIAQFDYDEEGAVGVEIAAVEFLVSNKSLDYAIVRLQHSDRLPLRRSDQPVQLTPESYDLANVIQHPNGEPKKVAFRNNLIYKAQPPEVTYFTDTQRGSSGSPVFDDTWRVIALHKASRSAPKAKLHGRQSGYVNVGTALDAILNDLEIRTPAIRDRLNAN